MQARTAKMNEEEFLRLLASEWSWEQIIYKLVEDEGLNPWDLDLKALSDAFIRWMLRLKELDFKIPAKFVIIAAVLLKLKSQDLRIFREPQPLPLEPVDFEPDGQTKLYVPPIQIPQKRVYRRPVVLEDLIKALRAALSTQQRRERRHPALQIETKQPDLSQQVEELFRKISQLGKKSLFSQLIREWKRERILEEFVPLIHLDFEGRIRCYQEKPFEDIHIEVKDGGKARPD